MFPNNMKPGRGNAIFTLHLESQSQYTVPCSAAKEPSQLQPEENRDKASERTHGPAKDTCQQDIKPAWKKMDVITFYLLFKDVFSSIIYSTHVIMYITYTICVSYIII